MSGDGFKERIGGGERTEREWIVREPEKARDVIGAGWGGWLRGCRKGFWGSTKNDFSR